MAILELFRDLFLNGELWKVGGAKNRIKDERNKKYFSGHFSIISPLSPSGTSFSGRSAIITLVNSDTLKCWLNGRGENKSVYIRLSKLLSQLFEL